MRARAGEGGMPGDAPETGTTIMAVVYKGGVVLGADSRVSTGTYVSNRASNKIVEFTSKVFLCRSGSAADTQAVSEYVRWFVDQHRMEIGAEPRVATVAELVKAMNYNNKQLLAAMIVAGWDDAEGGVVYGAPIGGTLARQQWAIDGSGSTYIWSLCDSEFREGMTRDEAEAYVTMCIAAAMTRDGSSGGLIRLVTVDAEGVRHRVVQGNDLPLFPGDIRAPDRAQADVPMAAA